MRAAPRQPDVVDERQQALDLVTLLGKSQSYEELIRANLN